MDTSFVLAFTGLSLLTSLHCRNFTMGTIEEIGIWSRYYPKGFVSPRRWVKKLFGITQYKIPKFLYFELFMSLFFAMLGPIEIIICVINYSAGGGNEIIRILTMFHACLVLINTIFLLIMSAIYKRK